MALIVQIRDIEDFISLLASEAEKEELEETVSMLKADVQADRLKADEIDELLNPDLAIELYEIIDAYLADMSTMDTEEALAIF